MVLPLPPVYMRPHQPWILWWATGVHIILGIALLLHPEAGRLAVLLGLREVIGGIGTSAMGLILIAVSVWTMFGILREAILPRRWIIAHLFPQYVLVIISLLTNVFILVDGEYMGRPFNFWAGLVGLWPALLGSLLHTFAVLERYFIRWHE